MKNNELANIVNGSRILITGGTGSFGKEFITQLLASYDPAEIVVFSRDEWKQHDMHNRIQSKKVNFVIGDVRDRLSIYKAMKQIDYVFHAAALKHVPVCEFFPEEAVKTNVLGAANVLDAAEEDGVKKVIVLSTDKAVYPINAMGMSKALMEKLVLAKARNTKSKTVFCGVRYGNVLYSRGSVIPLFVEQIKKNIQVTVTHPDMTRYLLPLPTAVELVFFALAHAEAGDILVRKSPASTVRDLAQATCEIFGHEKGIRTIGIREGEKFHETLVTREELMKAGEYPEYYRIRSLAQVDYDNFVVHGTRKEIPAQEYTSENTRRLNLKETKEFLLSLKEIKEALDVVPA